MCDSLFSKRISAILENIGEGVISTDFEGIIDFMNYTAEQLTGWASDESLGQPLDTIFRLINSSSREAVKSPLYYVLNTGKQAGLPNYTALITKSGIEKLISANTSPILNEHGKADGVVIIFRDVTRFKQYEEELRIEKNNLRINFEYAPIGMAIVADDCTIIDVNNSFHDTFGVKNSDLIGARFGEGILCKNSLSKGCGNSDLCETCQLRQSILEVLKNAKSIKNLEHDTILVKDNKHIQKYFSLNFAPIFDSQMNYVMVSVEDVSEYKIMEEKLRRSRDFFLTLFDDFPAFIWRTDSNIQLNYFNKRWLDFKGNTLEEELNKRWYEDVHPEDIESCRKKFTENIKNRLPIEMEYRIKRYDGNYRWFIDRASPYYDLDGNFEGYIGACHDITEQKLGDVALNKYKILAEKARDTILFVNMEGLIIEANESALRSYGYSKDEILTKTIFDLRGKDPETRKQMELAKHTGIFLEAIHFRKDGSSFPVEVSAQSTVIGGREVLLSVIRDVTERKKIEIALRDNEEKYRSLFNSSMDAIYFHELIETENGISSKLIEVNDAACRKLGYSKEELLRLSPSSIYSDKSLSGMDDIYKKIKDEAHSTFETTHITKNGIEIPVELSAHCFKMNGRNYFLISARDIAERKQAETEMKKAMETARAAYKAKSEFLANMSHEIRTPLNGVIGMIELTMLTNLSVEQKDNLLTAKTCADSLLKIINDILDFSKMEAGKLTIEKIDFDLRLLMEKIIKIHNFRAIEKGLKLNYQLPLDLPLSIKGDPSRLQQILNNLIGNAIKFTNNGSVNVTIKSLGLTNDLLKLKFIVSDTGIGIDLIEKEKLFKSFSQVDGSHSRKFGGTGLGLVISKRLVEMMGGSIWVESEKGKGSSFLMELNFEISNLNSEFSNNIEYGKFLKNQNRASVLLVEDDSINQIVVSRMLKEMGYSYSIANNGIEAISILKEKNFDLCLMDIQMPGMDGIQTTEAIRKNEQSTGTHLPIIALTAHALQGDKEKFLSLGMDDYLSKPFQMNDLYYMIEMLLAKYINDCTEDILKKLVQNDVNESAGAEVQSNDSNEDITLKILEIRKNISKLMQLLNAEDVATVEKLAHEIKLISSAINADKIKTIAFRIELAARKGDYASAYSLFSELNKVFKSYVVN